MSEELEARIVPRFSDGDDSATLQQLVADGVPVLAPQKHAQRVLEAAGPDGLAFVCDKRWDAFVKPKVAMVGGWGRPGTAVDAANDEHLALVGSFSEVLHDRRPLNLQMFHRVEEKTVPGKQQPLKQSEKHDEQEPRSDALPVLPRLLNWPCPGLFRTTTTSSPAAACMPPSTAPLAAAPAAMVVDRATRLSRKGAVTWWHLDDSGEHAFQVALPLEGASSAGGRGVGGAAALGVAPPPPPGDVPLSLLPVDVDRLVKVFIFAELDDYDFVFQDDETNATGRVAAIDPFTTPTVALPMPVTDEGCVVDVNEGEDGSEGGEGGERRHRRRWKRGRRLPRFWVAPLEAGGQPLLSPPNLPHMVLTVRDCVVVEERRVSAFFLDEVAYFLRRAAHWRTMPIIYGYLRNDLCEPPRLDAIVALLILSTQTTKAASVACNRSAAPSTTAGTPAEPNSPSPMAACALQSLAVLAGEGGGGFSWCDRFGAMGLGRSFLQPSAAKHRALMDAMGGEVKRGELGMMEVTRRWRRHKRVAQDMVRHQDNAAAGIFRFGSESGSGSGSDSAGHAACVTRRDGRAAWGPARASIGEARQDRARLLFALEAGGDSALGAALERLQAPRCGNGNGGAKGRGASGERGLAGVFGGSESESESEEGRGASG